MSKQKQSNIFSNFFCQLKMKGSQIKAVSNVQRVKYDLQMQFYNDLIVLVSCLGFPPTFEAFVTRSC